MKKNYKVLLFIMLFQSSWLNAQNVGINGSGAAPAASAGLDISFTDKGLLIPRVALTATNAAGPITGPTTSLLVYNTATAGVAPNNVVPGYYYWDGTVWVALGGSGGKDWGILGNAGTAVATNFIGTTDNNSFAFRTNNIERMRLRNDGIMTVNSGGAAFPTCAFYTNATANNDAIAGQANGTGSVIYGQQLGTGEAVTGLNNNAGGLAIGGYNNAAAGAGVGFGGFFSSAQTGGASLASEIGGGYGFFANSAVSAIATTTGGSKAIIAMNNTASGIVIQAQSTSNTAYGVISITDALNRGYSSIYGQVATPNQNGTGYTVAGTTSAVQGAISGTRTYSFGVLGLSSSNAFRTGAVLGLSAVALTWSSLGYRASNGTYYSMYITAAGGIGAGRMSQDGGPKNDVVGIGLGGYGDLMGQWIRGNVYGMNIKGNRYGLYVDGKTYTNNVIAQLSESDNGKQRDVAYATTSTNVDVLDRGMSQLSNGRIFIPFSNSFKNMASKEMPVMVTVTPNGASNGVFVESVTNDGFTIVENNNGTSNTKLTWIAIATRAGYENPETPEELLSKEYDANMDGVMFNENDLNGNATSIRWDGEKLYFSKTPLINTGIPAQSVLREMSEPNVIDKKHEVLKAE